MTAAMNVTSMCPQCGGRFELKLIGEMRDKHLVCPYCGHRVDVPDEYETTTRESVSTTDGSQRTVAITHRRRDLGPGESEQAPRMEQLLAGFGNLPEGKGTYRRERTLPDGSHVVETGMVHMDNNEIALDLDGGDISPERLGKLLGGRLDTDTAREIADMIAQAQSGGTVAGPGKEHTITRSETFTRTTVDRGELPGDLGFGSRQSPTRSSVLAWVIAAIAVLVLIVVLLGR